jgi:glutathione peroxidase
MEASNMPHFFKVLPAIVIACLVGAFPLSVQAAEAAPAACPALLQKTFNRLQDDAPQNLCQYAGKVLLIVNTASYCGFTPQYEGLEKLYANYSAQGLVVLGFPSNDFGQQEPGKSKDIADFCYNTYGVKFPMFEKSVVSGKSANPLFLDLAKAGGGTPRWNFYKYLVGRDGKLIDSYSSITAPDSGALLTDVKKALAQR